MARWPRDTSTYANKVGDAFKTNLREVAEAFANQERVDSVSKKHVDEAFSAMARLGLRSKTFLQRSDTWTGFGAFLVGLSFSMPDFCTAICSAFDFSEKFCSVASLSLTAILFGLGTATVVWAKHQGSLPKKPGAA